MHPEIKPAAVVRIGSDPHARTHLQAPSCIIKSPPAEESTTRSVQHSEDERRPWGEKRKKKKCAHKLKWRKQGLWSRISSTSSGISEYKLCRLQTCRCPTGPVPSLSYTPAETRTSLKNHTLHSTTLLHQSQCCNENKPPHTGFKTPPVSLTSTSCNRTIIHPYRSEVWK